MADNNYFKTPSAEQSFDDPTVAAINLEDRSMRIINAIKIKNRIKEVTDDFMGSSINVDEVDETTLRETIYLTLQLRRQYVALNKNEKVDECQTIANRLSKIVNNLDEMKKPNSEREMPYDEFSNLTLSLAMDIQNMYAHSLTEGIVGEL